MARSEIVQFPFRAGIDEGSDPKALQPGTLKTLTNGVWDKTGRIKKRQGTELLTAAIANGGGNIAAGARIVNRGSEPQVIDATNLYSYIGQASVWRQVDRPPNLRATWRNLIDAAEGVESVDCSLATDLLIVAYVSAGRGYVMALDRVTKTKVLPPTYFATDVQHLRVIADLVEGVAHIFYSTGAAGSITVTRLSLTTFALANPVAKFGGAKAGSAFDVILSGTSLFWALELAAGTDRLRIGKTDATNAYNTLASSATINGTAANYQDISLAIVDTAVLVVWCENTGNIAACAARLATDLTLVNAPTTFANQSARVLAYKESTGKAVIGYSLDSFAAGDAEETFRTFRWDMTTFGLDSETTRRGSHHTRHASKPWTVNSRWYVAVTTRVIPEGITSADPRPAATHAIVEIQTSDNAGGGSSIDAPHLHVATLEPETAWYVFGGTGGGNLASAPVDADGNVYLGVPYALDPVGANFAGQFNQVAFQLAEVRPADTQDDVWRNYAAPDTPFCAGGAPFYADGHSTFPAGFLHAPIVLSLSSNYSSGEVVNSNYGYVAVYEYPDADGRMHRSPPSAMKFTGANAGGTIAVEVACTSLSCKQSPATGYANVGRLPVRIAVYRTLANGSVPYRLGRQITNEPLVHSVSFSDGRSDADTFDTTPTIALSTREQLYTEGGILDEITPPSFLTVLVQLGRSWGLAGDEHTVWASKPYAEDPFIAPGWNEALTLYFENRKNALASLDETVLVFGEDSIHLIAGDGPDLTGQNRRWQVAALQVDFGCSQPRSVVSTPLGVMFRSTRGIEIVPRAGRTVAWIGETVKDVVDAYPVVTSAVLVPKHHHVRFSLVTAAESDCVVLVYDYLRQSWGVFDYNQNIADAACIDDVYTFVTFTGRVYREDPDTHLDNGTYVALDVETQPIAPAGAQAWHRVKDVQLLATSLSNHGLTISVKRDYATSAEQTKTFAALGDVTTVGPHERMRMTLARQKGQAFSFRITDATPGGNTVVGNGAGPQLEGMALYVGVKKGLPRAGANRRG